MVNRRQVLGSMGAAGTSALPPAKATDLGAGEPSHTARAAALHRAAHQILDTPPVFRDPLAAKILGPDGQGVLHSGLEHRQKAASRAMRAFIVMRSRYAEDELAAACDDGVRQYVILGAGLDTFAYREPLPAHLRMFEVDHPATQGWKRRLLQDLGIETPAGLAFVPLDFEKETLGDSLDRAAFDRRAPAFVSWLGVSMYLTKEAVADTLGFFPRACARGTQIVFDFAVPDAMLGNRERARRDERALLVSQIGEPWISFFDPDVLAGDLMRLGFGGTTCITADDANARYFADRQDGFRVVGSGRVMKATV